jgi:hypothetical protein
MAPQDYGADLGGARPVKGRPHTPYFRPSGFECQGRSGSGAQYCQERKSRSMRHRAIPVHCRATRPTSQAGAV